MLPDVKLITSVNFISLTPYIVEIQLVDPGKVVESNRLLTPDEVTKYLSSRGIIL